MKVFYGAQQLTDSPSDGWQAIKVYADGNPIVLAGPFETEEQAEAAAAGAKHLDTIKSLAQLTALQKLALPKWAIEKFSKIQDLCKNDWPEEDK